MLGVYYYKYVMKLRWITFSNTACSSKNVLVFQTRIYYISISCYNQYIRKHKTVGLLGDSGYRISLLGELLENILNDVKFVCTNLQLCTSKTNVLCLPKYSHSFAVQSQEYLGNTATYCLKVIVTKIRSSFFITHLCSFWLLCFHYF